MDRLPIKTREWELRLPSALLQTEDLVLVFPEFGSCGSLSRWTCRSADLLIPQRHHRGHPRGTPRRERAGHQRNQRGNGAREGKRPRNPAAKGGREAAEGGQEES